MRRLVPHAVLAVAALVAAFAVYRHGRGVPAEDANEQPSVVVAEIARRDLQAVTYQSESRRVEVDLSPAEPPYWVTVTTRTKQPEKRPEPPARGGPDAGTSPDAGGGPRPAPDGGPPEASPVPDGPEPGPEAEPEWREDVMRFAANEQLDELLGTLAPLKVVRRLGKVSTLSDFELDEPRATLTLELREGRRVLKVGGRTYGGGDHYVLDETSGEVYLLGSAVLRDVELAQSRLFQRRLHRFEEQDAATAVIRVGGTKRTLEHRNRAREQDRAWVFEDAPESSEQVGNWMRQLGRLRALSYPGGEGQPIAPEPVVRVEYRDEGGGELGFVEIVRLGTPGASSEYMARSEATGIWVDLAQSVAEQIVEDSAGLVGEGPP